MEGATQEESLAQVHEDAASATTNSEFLEKWGYDLEDLYKIALKFFKGKLSFSPNLSDPYSVVLLDKEGKAFQLRYDEKCKLSAFTQQVSHGPFKPEVHGNYGVLDVVGKDRKIAWQKLGDTTKENAMLNFVNTLNEVCPLFHPFVEAHKKDMEMKAEREKEEKERQLVEEEKRKLAEEEEKQKKAELEEQEEKRKQIKEALNLQTYAQFKTYAEQQYPENPDQQAILIRQLQEQHYIQYMQQIYQQQTLAQSHKSDGPQYTQELPLDVEAAALNALSNVQNIPVEPDNVSETSEHEHEGNIS